uniref:CdvA-like coiled-coil domain-containing protein n=1 Tax=Ignisphaera aggregans TaxID=334771 RepID=A0A7C4FHA7_9CREN
MSISIESIAPVIGQTITDVYGRKAGVLVSIYSDIDGKVTAIEIMVNDSHYETLPSERLEHGVDGLKILPEWLVEAKKLERKLDILKKRFKATEELYKKNQIPAHAYRELKDKFSKEVEKAKVEVKNIKDVLRRRLYELENFVIHIEKAMTHLMVNYTAGEVPENGFKISADLMRFARQTALEEKKDLEKHVSLIEKLEQELVSVTTSGAEEQSLVPPVPATASASATPLSVKVVS